MTGALPSPHPRSSGTGQLPRPLGHIIASLALLLAAAHCGGDPVGPTVVTVAITPSAPTIAALGVQLQLTAEARDAGGHAVGGRTFAWGSSDTGIVRVSPTGLVTAVAHGGATVTATSDGIAGRATVTVGRVTTVAVMPVSVTLPALGATVQLTAEARDSGGATMTGQTVAWTSSDTSIARVSASGLVTSSGFGSATIIAGAGSAEGTSAVTVDRVAARLAARVATGGTHSCALTPAGVAYCWGSNGSGQLGDGTTSDRSNPVAVLGGLSFRSITAGLDHTCGLTAGGAAYCWGDNSRRQLGDGTSTNSTSPVAVAGGLAFQSISAGWYLTCGVTAAGAAYCWGGNSLGNPVPVEGGMSFQAIAVGVSHTCAITLEGAAYCWGENGSGKLGNGTTAGSTSPVAVAGTLTFQAIGAGYSHSCGLSVGGAVYCWGSNGSGKLGDGTTRVNSTTPVPVTGGLVFQALSAGQSHTCGLTAGGAAYCWGENALGQLGDGTTASRSAPTRVAGGLAVAAISAGGYRHTCAITLNGEARCWGSNEGGQAGDGVSGTRSSPAAVAGGLAFQELDAGWERTCGLTVTGAAYCWGLDGLGDGTNAPSMVPVAVTGGHTFRAISSGGWHTCALTSASAAFCWGSNSTGALGDGSTTSSNAPVAVAGGLAFETISAGESNTCAVTSGGSAYCWGSGGVLAPVAFADSLSFQMISAGTAHTCGLTTGGDAYCWGLNVYGELGDGSLVSSPSPVRVAGGLTFVSIAAGAYHTCGIVTDGTAYCWGSNMFGGLGDGTTSDRPSPVLAAGGMVLQSIATGYWHTCGLTPAGVAYCWGEDPSAVPSSPSFLSVTAGHGHACGVAAGGVAYCWGDSFGGKLGDGTGFHLMPVAVVGGIAFGAPPSGAEQVRRAETSGT